LIDFAIQAPKDYVEALLAVHKKNLEVVNESFRGEAGFVASLDKVSLIFPLLLSLTFYKPTLISFLSLRPAETSSTPTLPPRTLRELSRRFDLRNCSPSSRTGCSRRRTDREKLLIWRRC